MSLLFPWARSKLLKALSRKRDFDLLRKQSVSFSYKWLKVFLYVKECGTLQVAWSLQKKYVSGAVTRNRLKRWGRENLRKSSLRGLIIVVFLQGKGKNFYKRLKRKEFDHVFNTVLEKIIVKI